MAASSKFASPKWHKLSMYSVMQRTGTSVWDVASVVDVMILGVVIVAAVTDNECV